MAGRKPRILILCTGNACRSQMAEGWVRRLHGDRYEVHSSGLEAHGQNPQAIQAMADLGVDIAGQESSALADLHELEFDHVITVCDHAAENMPALPGSPACLHEPFPDPPALAEERPASESDACYRDVALSIRAWVEDLPRRLHRS